MARKLLVTKSFGGGQIVLLATHVAGNAMDRRKKFVAGAQWIVEKSFGGGSSLDIHVAGTREWLVTISGGG